MGFMGTVGALGEAPAPTTGMGISTIVGALWRSGRRGLMGTVGADSLRSAGVSFRGLPAGSPFGPREVGLSCPMRLEHLDGHGRRSPTIVPRWQPAASVPKDPGQAPVRLRPMPPRLLVRRCALCDIRDTFSVGYRGGVSPGGTAAPYGTRPRAEVGAGTL